MKKCASCSKDLPDAALHCVFCGAKQPPAPATTGGLAKTVMGSYSASDVMEQLKNQQPGGAGPGAPRPMPGNAPAYGAPAAAPGPVPGPGSGPSPFQRPPAGPTPAPPMAIPGPAGMPTMPVPAPPMAPQPMHNPHNPAQSPHNPAQGPTQFGGPPQQGGYGGSPPVPAAPSHAATMFAPGPGGPPQGGFGGPQPRPMPQLQPQPQSQPFAPPPAGAFNVGGPGPQPQPYSPQPQPQPYSPQPMPLPMPQQGLPPYLAQGAARGGRPIEPWRDSLRHVMFIWGGALLLLFVTPIRAGDPWWFMWDEIAEAPGKAKLVPLLIAAVGLLSIVLALIPTPPTPRGLIAGILGLAGIAIPVVLAELTDWKVLVPLAGTVLLIPGLLIRNEYRESLLARILVTLGAIAVLLPLLLPENDKLPLVETFKQAIDLPGKAKVMPLLRIGSIVVVVLTLLAWIPAPATGGAKVFAWILLLWPAVIIVTALAVNDKLGDLPDAPFAAIVWISGAGIAGAVGTAYGALVGYGFATVIGKQLE